jgi:hypothetical protein
MLNNGDEKQNGADLRKKNVSWCLLMVCFYFNSMPAISMACQLISIYFDSFWFILIQFDSVWFSLIHFDSFWFILIHFDSFQFTSIHFNSLQFTSIHFDSFWFILIHFDPFWSISIQIDPFWSISIQIEITSKLPKHFNHTPAILIHFGLQHWNRQWLADQASCTLSTWIMRASHSWLPDLPGLAKMGSRALGSCFKIPLLFITTVFHRALVLCCSREIE